MNQDAKLAIFPKMFCKLGPSATHGINFPSIQPRRQPRTYFFNPLIVFLMILLSYSNSSIKGTEILGSILYLSLLQPAIFACVLSGRKLIFNFNSWLSFQRLCRLLQGLLTSPVTSFRLDDHNLLALYSTTSELGRRAFGYSAPLVWNSWKLVLVGRF